MAGAGGIQLILKYKLSVTHISYDLNILLNIMNKYRNLDRCEQDNYQLDNENITTIRNSFIIYSYDELVDIINNINKTDEIHIDSIECISGYTNNVTCTQIYNSPNSIKNMTEECKNKYLSDIKILDEIYLYLQDLVKLKEKTFD